MHSYFHGFLDFGTLVYFSPNIFRTWFDNQIANKDLYLTYFFNDYYCLLSDLVRVRSIEKGNCIPKVFIHVGLS